MNYVVVQGPYGRSPPPPVHRMLARPFDPFRGVGGLFSAMEDLQERAMNDPHSHVFTQSTMVTFGEDGQPRVVENSIRKSGDVKETRRSLRDGEREEMAIGHTIGDRTHIIEKKRDKDGNVRRQQRFVNLDECRFFYFCRYTFVCAFRCCYNNAFDVGIGSVIMRWSVDMDVFPTAK
ncbi:hypothetical protein Y032_0868g2779 [Ancylostoma ceylanicum]|uniref:Uncharacterized protein n=1 Tax=Ancylostoma ceylanicum TaxID=53326 RepID=A0A016WA08_9BILA|nr:hypothetical protein Y032_0868g2779 [Ancylostoma ceylanicum]